MKQRNVSLAALGLLVAVAAYAVAPLRLQGDLVPPNMATRSIRIDPATRYVNVRWGDTVAFLSNGKEFAYRFDGVPGETSFDLRRVAPPGIVDHEVTTYIRGPYEAE
jgi:hypothetical protein